MIDARRLLLEQFSAAVQAVSAEGCMPRDLPRAGSGGRTRIVAIGKAAAAMAAAAVERLDAAVSGLVVTRAGHGLPPGALPPELQLIEAGHPLPDSDSTIAARRALELAGELSANDCLLFLVSGGGSALLALPAPGVSLADKQSVTRALLRSGATIAEINCVRGHLSQIKGGRLALAAAPARVVTLAISDVPGDHPALIASGPTIADRTTLADARAVLERHRVAAPASVTAALLDPRNETPKPDVPGFPPGEVRVIARARDALAAAAGHASARGCTATILGDDLQGEARALGAQHAALARKLASESAAAGIDGVPHQPQVLLSGGETTVTVVNPAGRGGRNLEYLLAMAITLDGAAGIHALACDTDGIDGTEDCAGAIVTPDTLLRAASLGLDARALLAANDAYRFFEALGDLIDTGPTRTNVNDFRAVLIDQVSSR